jgi:hypothetical protein
MAPLSDELQRLVDALDVVERDEDATGTERNAPAEYGLGPQPGRPCGRGQPACRRADTQRARCKNSDATRSTIGVWLDALAMVFRLHHQGASGLAFAKQKKSHALEDTLLLLIHNVSEGQSHNPRSVASAFGLAPKSSAPAWSRTPLLLRPGRLRPIGVRPRGLNGNELTKVHCASKELYPYLSCQGSGPRCGRSATPQADVRTSARECSEHWGDDHPPHPRSRLDPAFEEPSIFEGLARSSHDALEAQLWTHWSRAEAVP